MKLTDQVVLKISPESKAKLALLAAVEERRPTEMARRAIEAAIAAHEAKHGELK